MLSFIKTASYNFRRMIRKSEVVLVTMLPNLFRRHKISYIKIDTLLSNSIKKIFIWNNHVSNILQCPANTVIGDLVPIHLIFSRDIVIAIHKICSPLFWSLAAPGAGLWMLCQTLSGRFLHKNVKYSAPGISPDNHLVVLTDAILVFLLWFFHQIDQSLAGLCIIAQGDAILHLKPEQRVCI